MNHYQLMTLLAHDHIQELTEEASRHRLARALRRGRRQLWPDSHPEVGPPKSVGPAGRVGSCEVRPQVAEPVR
jgi:hypothetical protein